MMRKIIQIDEDRCIGCGKCADACHEGAIGMADGKARLLRDDYCDGLGDCLPECPVNAISFVEREAAEYDAAAAAENMKKKSSSPALMNWPVQIKLAPVKAPYYDSSDILIAADCTAYAYAGFHKEFMDGRITLIGCPKLDGVDYSEKLAGIFEQNDVKSVTLIRMEVPCCGGLQMAVAKALKASGKNIPGMVEIITTDGKIAENI